jgi:hypothetical protein
MLISEGNKFVTLLGTVAYEVQAFRQSRVGTETYNLHPEFVTKYKQFTESHPSAFVTETKLWQIFLNAPGACKIARVSLTIQLNQHELAKQQDEDYECLDGKLTSQNTMISQMVGAISDRLGKLLPDGGLELTNNLRDISRGHQVNATLSPSRQLSSGTLASNVQGIYYLSVN